ncbi:DUF4145 domain-containing protein [Caulobacter segnis]
MPVLMINCPHCPINQVAASQAWEGSVRDKSYHWYVTLLCGSCGKPITAMLRANSYPNKPSTIGAANLQDKFEVLDLWPQRVEFSAPNHSPENVARRFLEGEVAFRQRSWNAAVAMYRSALDIATKALDGVPKGLTFFKRLQWLHEQHRITPDMKDWADHVRVEGNEALHDPEDFTEEDARPLRLFTEMFLRYIFELPGEVAAFREGP